MRRLGLRDAIVDSLRVGDQCVARRIARGELAPFQLRGAQQAELQLEAVGVQGRLPDHLGQPALALPAHQVHLEEPEPRMHVSGRQEEVVVGLRHDVGCPIGFEADGHWLL